MLKSQGGVIISEHFSFILFLKYPPHSYSVKMRRGCVRGLLVQMMVLLGSDQIANKKGLSLMIIFQFLPQNCMIEWSILIKGSLHFRPPLVASLQIVEQNFSQQFWTSQGLKKQADLEISLMISSLSFKLKLTKMYLKRSCQTLASWLVSWRQEDESNLRFLQL